MTVRVTVIGEPSPRGNEQHRPALRHAAKKSCNEAEGGRQVAGGFGYDFVQGSERKAILR